MDPQTRKHKIKEMFDAASAGYDMPALRFFSHAADELVERLELTGGEHILDVACGTGTVTLACARRLRNGRVTGVDLSEGMLEKARIKLEIYGFGNVEFRCADLENMRLETQTFDGACCGFGLFFLPDMQSALEAIAAHVKADGKIGISSFTGQVMEPLSQAFTDRIQTYGVLIPPLAWKRLDEAAKHHDLYEAASMNQVETHRMQAGYYLAGFAEWWDILWYSGFRGLLNQLSGDDLTRFKQEHQHEIESLATTEGLWLNVEVLISVERKPR